MLTKKQMQHKIDNEIIVDCYDEYEMGTGWFTFMEDTLEFPFMATAKLKKRDGSLEEKKVKIVGLASDEENFMHNDFNLEVEMGEYICPIACSLLKNIKATSDTHEALAIWKYWIAK